MTVTVHNLEERRRKVAELVARYTASRSEYVTAGSAYNESQLRNDYLNDLLIALGWDLANNARRPQHLRTVVLEQSLDVEDDDVVLRKRPDYTMRVRGQRKLFIEAKKPSVALLTSQSSAFQTRRYGWNAKLSISILTNFEQLIIYDCSARPHSNQAPQVGRIKIYNFNELVTRFDELHDELSFESCESGRFDECFPVNIERTGTEAFDDFFLAQISEWRLSLAQALARENKHLDAQTLGFVVQRILNRIIFLRICEDRNLEDYAKLKAVGNYDELKELFEGADARYNSGLFDLIQDTISANVRIPNDVLIRIFSELYFPESPYAFSVVEPSLLGEIYELFLANEIKLDANRNVTIEGKPEAVVSNGVVSTPGFIVNSILERTLEPLCSGKTPEEISHLRIADISCGSGVFLLGAYQFLVNYHLEWYLSHGEQNYTAELCRDLNGGYSLTLAEKHRILLNCIYGVDIDYQAVEVAQFSLLLKTIEDVTREELELFLARQDKRALPMLDRNIQCGNSLVDQTFNTYLGNRPLAAGQLIQINAFDFSAAFEHFEGFDAIIGNPPYVRTQNMIRYSPEEVNYFKSGYSPYLCSKQDIFDKYSLFIERGLQLLKADGILGYVVSHKFFTIRSGRALRSLISSGQHLKEIVHFGTQQIIPGGTLTYTCLLILEKAACPRFSVEHVHDLDSWKRNMREPILYYAETDVSEDPWIFTTPEVQKVFDRIRDQNRNTLSDVADVFVGVQTSADKLYIIKNGVMEGNFLTFTDPQKRTHSVERSILRPCFYKVKFDAYDSPAPNASMIFPYQIHNGRAALYTVEEMQARFPRCWDYLNLHREQLAQRDLQGAEAEQWYCFGRSQSLTQFDGRPKLVWPVLSLEPKYALDTRDSVFTGGGNGPYYGLRIKLGQRMSISYLQALLCHPILDAYVLVSGSRFQGDYISHGKQFVERIPIRVIDFNNPTDVLFHDQITENVIRMEETRRDLEQTRLPTQHQTLMRRFSVLRHTNESLVDQLYGIDAADHVAIRMNFNPDEQDEGIK